MAACNIEIIWSFHPTISDFSTGSNLSIFLFQKETLKSIEDLSNDSLTSIKTFFKPKVLQTLSLQRIPYKGTPHLRHL